MGDTINLLVIVCGPIYASFLALERVVAPDRKKDIAAWLKGKKVHGSLATWPQQFVALFDRVFGELHLSWKCFLRSCLASALVMAALALLWVVRQPDDAVLYAQRMNDNILENLHFFFVFNFIWNICTDFFALLACRYIIGCMVSRGVSFSGSLAYAALGTLASAVTYLFITVYIGIIVATVLWYRAVPVAVEVNWQFVHFVDALWANGLNLGPGSGSTGVFFYSGLFTSAWAWLYFASASSIRAARGLGPAIGFMRYTMDVEARPLECIGVVATAIAGMIILLASLVSIFVGYW